MDSYTTCKQWLYGSIKNCCSNQHPVVIKMEMGQPTGSGSQTLSQALYEYGHRIVFRVRWQNINFAGWIRLGTGHAVLFYDQVNYLTKNVIHLLLDQAIIVTLAVQKHLHCTDTCSAKWHFRFMPDPTSWHMSNRNGPRNTRSLDIWIQERLFEWKRGTIIWKSAKWKKSANFRIDSLPINDFFNVSVPLIFFFFTGYREERTVNVQIMSKGNFRFTKTIFWLLKLSIELSKKCCSNYKERQIWYE